MSSLLPTPSKINTGDCNFFRDRGFEVYDLGNHFDENVVKAMANKYRPKVASNSKAIFNDGNPTQDSGKRRQYKIPKSTTKNDTFLSNVKSAMIHYSQTINPKYDTLFDMVFLYSKEHCGWQKQHMDRKFTQQESFLSCIFTLDKKTNFKINGQEIELDRCSLLIFHSNTPHQGGTTDNSTNLRIHAVVGAQTLDRPGNETLLIMTPCKHCNSGHSTARKRYDHERYCKKNPEYETNRAKKNQSSLQSYYSRKMIKIDEAQRELQLGAGNNK